MGDVLAQVSVDRTTMIPCRFYESPDVKTNDRIWYHNQNKNKTEKDEWKRKQQELHSGWWKKHVRNRNKVPTFGQIPQYKVKPSDIIPRKKGTIYIYCVLYIHLCDIL